MDGIPESQTKFFEKIPTATIPNVLSCTNNNIEHFCLLKNQKIQSLLIYVPELMGHLRQIDMVPVLDL
jgi:hypothetical protein